MLHRQASRRPRGPRRRRTAAGTPARTSGSEPNNPPVGRVPISDRIAVVYLGRGRGGVRASRRRSRTASRPPARSVPVRHTKVASLSGAVSVNRTALKDGWPAAGRARRGAARGWPVPPGPGQPGGRPRRCAAVATAVERAELHRARPASTAGRSPVIQAAGAACTRQCSTITSRRCPRPFRRAGRRPRASRLSSANSTGSSSPSVRGALERHPAVGARGSAGPSDNRRRTATSTGPQLTNTARGPQWGTSHRRPLTALFR
ncbi:hypothetical protein DC74_7 [Streptomyces noursei]|uniref:Uncharacterized protein n=1 Tax=Streptomyces noursei TaxID=1971 RepID=A0A059VT40_STRNR|nr:hypothetical protein DC74_7 [Streptomyces noursei]GCB88136.1 hypothetical protein SALB_00805 [Streptomyces noursei]